MIWSDLHVERPLSEAELRAWIRSVFAIDDRLVAVEKQYDYPSDPALLASHVFVAWDQFTGQYPFRVTVAVKEPSLEHVDEVAAIDALARQTGARLIVFDDSPEPDHVLLVEPDGTRRGAYVDPDALDHDSYEIAFYEGREQRDGEAANG